MTAVYDAGALIALDRGDRSMWALLKTEVRQGRTPVTHGGVVGQAWRNGARQVQLARALPALETLALDEGLGRAAGALLASTATADVIDAALAMLAQDGDVIYTSDTGDISALASARNLHVDIVPV